MGHARAAAENKFGAPSSSHGKLTSRMWRESAGATAKPKAAEPLSLFGCIESRAVRLGQEQRDSWK
jgi:hypothetical protein